MGKAQKKTGKGRLDKYYKLAKEQGYRARSAFKLIQLNKKYSFLETARCCIDLCAAPGGWLQVASKYMPVNSIIVGVDLVPIKPIPRVITFASDITTPHCRNLIRNEVKDWKADVVLHDGAPNVGTAWVQDAYSQSELVLMSLKLAVEFLLKGGTFVTKVFRSADYNSLIWVFSQLFGKVEATKPPSSRIVSAEIFVVCRDFLAPKHIDPKFLDPKHVFKDLSGSGDSVDKSTSANNAKANVFQPDKKRRKRDGYDDGDYILFKKIGASEFIKSQDPVAVLGTVNKIAFESDEEKEWSALDITSEEVKSNLDDLKVLGKGDFKVLMNWRKAVREEIGLDVKTVPTEELTEAVEITEEADEEDQIRQELERLTAETAAKAKRDRRKANEIRTRTIQRMQLQMTAPLDIGLEQGDDSLRTGQDEDIFDLRAAENDIKKQKSSIQYLGEKDTMDDQESVEDEGDESTLEGTTQDNVASEQRVDRLEAELDGLYDSYRDRLAERDAKFKAKQERQKNKDREETWTGFTNNDNDSDISGDESDGGYERMLARKERDDGQSSSDEDSDESELEEDSGNEVPSSRKRKRPSSSKAAKLQSGLITKLEQPQTSRAAQIWFDQDVFSDMDDIDQLEDDSHREEEEDEDETPSFQVENASNEDDSEEEDDIEIVPQDDDDVEMWDVDQENEDAVKQKAIQKHGLVTAEAVTLAQQLVNRQTTKTQLINDGFNRYSLNSKEGLPSWFLDDEAKNYKSNIPITKEAVAALRAKQRALDARPIKKIAEAKARKKMRAVQRLEKAMKKAEGVNQTSDLSEKDKAAQIEKLMRKGLSNGKKQRPEVKLVVAKGVHKGLKGRPKGVKGRYVMVDSRMKKEVRAQKRKEKSRKSR